MTNLPLHLLAGCSFFPRSSTPRYWIHPEWRQSSRSCSRLVSVLLVNLHRSQPPNTCDGSIKTCYFIWIVAHSLIFSTAFNVLTYGQELLDIVCLCSVFRFLFLVHITKLSYLCFCNPFSPFLNRPLPKYFWLLFQSESLCSSFHMKISFIHMQMKTNFHMKR